MAINNANSIVNYTNLLTSDGLPDLVFQKRVPVQEQYTRGSDGSHTIPWTFTLVTTQEAEKQDIVNSTAYQELISPFVLGAELFYPDNITISRVNHVFGSQPDKTTGLPVPAAKWEAKVTFKSSIVINKRKDREVVELKPSEKPATITWSSNRFDMATTTDANGNTYQNTAGDYFEGISRPEQERVYTISFAVAIPVDPMVSPTEPKSQAVIQQELEDLAAAGTNYEPEYLGYSNYTNDNAVYLLGTRWAVNTLLVTSMTASEAKVATNEVYFNVKLTLAARWWGWHREVANRGTNELIWFIPEGAIRPYNLDDINHAISPLPREKVKVVMGSPGLDQMLDFWRNEGGPDNVLVGESNQWAYDNRAIFQEAKVPITDAKGKPLRSPVFLDGYGQQDSSAAVAPGVLGNVVWSSNDNFAFVDFNVFDFLGQKVTFEEQGISVYIPQQAVQLESMLIKAGINAVDAADMLTAKVTDVLPMVQNAGVETVSNDFTGVRTNSGVVLAWFEDSGQDFIRLTPGVKLSFQDYRSAPIHNIPGIYLGQ